MRESIIVLGLPLSRTSVIADSLSALGVFSGSKLMMPLLLSSSEAKSLAYYEYNEISQLNKHIMIENNSSWDDVNFSLEDLSSRRIKHYVDLAKKILRKDYKYINKIVINDPKICFLFPVWERALNELGINIKILLVNSNPLGIAYLLKQQDKQSLEKGLILWSDYFFRSESYSRKYERLFADYPNNLADFKKYLEQLAAFSGNKLTDSILKTVNQSYLLQLKNPHIRLKNISLDFPPYFNKLIGLLADGDLDNSSRLNDLYQEFSSLKKFFFAKNPAEVKPLEQLTEFKRDETRIVFDEGYYLDKYEDVRAARIDPFKHYQEFGWREGRDPCAGFSTTFYLKSNPDVKQDGINPLQHYVISGQYENRAPKLRFIRTIPVSSQSPSVLFVGHSALKGRAQFALLDIVKWYAENTTYQITVLLLNPGILSAEFMRYGDVLTLNKPLEVISDKSRKFLAHYYDLIYLNTLASGLFVDVYKRNYAYLEIPVVLHIHESGDDIEKKYKPYYARMANHVDLHIAASNDIADVLINKYKVNPDNIWSCTSVRGEIENTFNCIRERYQFPPSLSVIVPNHNYADYLKERIDSVLKQDFYDLEILLLDDASSDNSLAVIDSYRDDTRIKVLTNKTCSGSPFKQWNKGISVAASEYIWIAESDDACSANLVKELLGAFNDPQVVLSYCRSEIINENGQHIPGSLTQYMERGHLSKFNAPYVLDGNKEVEENFAVACTIVNGSSVLFKKAVIIDALDRAMQFKMCGDWYLYLRALCNGKIAYTTNAVNYFRRHQGSMVHEVVGTDVYFKERFEIAKEIVKTFNVSKPVLKKMLEEIDSEWERLKHIPKKQSYEALFDKSNIIQAYERHVIAPMKIGFYVHGFLFSKGGIERLAADLANYLSNRGHEIVIFCRQHKGSPVYSINKDITVVSFFDENKKHTIADLRNSLDEYNLDVFVPMLSEWIFEPVIEAAEGLGFPIVASEHNSPEIIETRWWNREQRIKTFEKVDIVHLLRENYKESLPSSLQDKIRVINNGSNLGKWSKVKNKKYFKRIISVGRLAPQKRLDRLIQAFSILTESIDANWKLDIYGEGPEQESLQELIASYNLNHRVKLRGNKNNLEREYLSSDIFVLPSEFEGDPVVLVEAKMFGLPCVAYKDCPGANEAIQHNVNGLLAEPDDNGVELAKQLVKLVQDRTLLNQFSKAAKENSKLLDMRLIAEQWEKMIHEAVFFAQKA